MFDRKPLPLSHYETETFKVFQTEHKRNIWIKFPWDFLIKNLIKNKRILSAAKSIVMRSFDNTGMDSPSLESHYTAAFI